MQEIVIGQNQAGQRLDKFLRKYLPEAPGSFLYKMLRKKNITLNGKKAEGKEMLSLGDEVKLFFSEETLAKFSGRLVGNAVAEEAGRTGNNGGDAGAVTASPSAPGLSVSGSSASGSSAFSSSASSSLESELAAVCRRAYHALQGIEVLYEDENVLILNKPAGVLTQKAEAKDVSLNEWMIGYLLEEGAVSQEELRFFRPSVCNRLDRNTSGLVLCGKSLAGSQELSRIIRERTVRKFYRTVAAGRIDHPSRIEGYLVKDECTNKVTVTKQKHQASDASYIQTAYTPLKFLVPSGAGAWRGYTYLEVELITGKPHQIRAHLAGAGHPLLGDYKYGNRSDNDLYGKKYHITSQLLHAYRLEFPVMKGALEALSGRIITAPLPRTFETILEAWQDHG